MSPSSTAVRNELRDVRSAIRDKQKRERQLLDALTALGEQAPNGDGPAKRKSRGPDKRKRLNGAVREAQALDLLRRHPQTGFSATQIHKGTGMSITTAMAVQDRLLERGQVVKIGETKRGAVVTRYKPVAISPGNGIVARNGHETEGDALREEERQGLTA